MCYTEGRSRVPVTNAGPQGFPPLFRVIFSEAPHKKEETVFDKTKAKVDTLVNDRVSAPIRTSILISCAAFVIAGIALLLVVSRGND